MTFKYLNDNKVTVQANLSHGLIGKARISRKGLHSDTIENILHAYPDLNPVWFVLGLDEMIIAENTSSEKKESVVNEASPPYDINQPCKICAEKDNRINDLLSHIDRLDKMLNRLTSHEYSEQKRKVG